MVYSRNTDVRVYPVGKSHWDVNLALCPDNLDGLTMSLTSCRRGEEFTCVTGYCVPIQARCDKIRDCMDGSDERDCYIVDMDSDTYSSTEPPHIPQGTSLEVNVSLNLLDISNIEELSSSVTIKLLLEVRWRDSRLYFRNLQPNPMMNNFRFYEKSQIWVPGLYIENTMYQVIHADANSHVYVERGGEGYPNPLTEPMEALLYEGAHNTIVLRRIVDMNIQCTFDLHDFPFDTQKCFINFACADLYQEQILLQGSEFSYSGDSKLAQFLVEGWGVVNGQTVQFWIQLKRIFFYQLVATYIPSACLLAITVVTIYIDGEHFEAQIMVALTAMLVMYTLFQSISSSLPQTAYLKMIDIWLAFGLFMPFVVFCMEVLVELYNPLQQPEQPAPRSPSISSKDSRLIQSSGSRRPILISAIRWFARIGIPAIVIAFMVCYWITALKIYIAPTNI